jgi:hypothetical protein
MFYNPLEQFEIYSVFSFIDSCLVLTMQEESKTNTIPIIIGIGTSVIVSIAIYKLIKKSKTPINSRYYVIELNHVGSITNCTNLINKKLGFIFRFVVYNFILICQNNSIFVYLHLYSNIPIFGWVSKFFVGHLSHYRCVSEKDGLQKLREKCSRETLETILEHTENPEKIIFSCNSLREKFLTEVIEPSVQDIMANCNAS